MFLLFIAHALVRISIIMINDSGGKTNVFAVDCRGINQNFYFYDIRLWREDKCFCC
jgi:hypothetical protein